MKLTRWQTLLGDLGLESDDDEFHKLFGAYGEAHRHYHTRAHIEDCLEQFDRVRVDLEHPAAVEIALWYHDAVYQPRSNSNELDSVRWAVGFLRNKQADHAVIERVEQLIMATLHSATPTLVDARWLVDIDLSILGRDERTYSRFERNVRAEYEWVPLDAFRARRAEILQSFIARERIYSSPFFYERFEAAARRNLNEAIAALRG
ncbi:MAG: N-methyl-D-aspartate receptor NMDAR2C subunit [Gammaproteobacteria bacterium]|nr:N-methyl-D-aspartate receptor NMDAR2C subunit [Gammaproteobacteria bacterium]